jgi:methionine sulfoxide reductase heme-binding subunit
MTGARSFPIWLALLLSLASVAVGWSFGGNPADDAMFAARYTARVSFPLFILVYVAAPMQRLRPSDFWRSIVRRRRQWGLGFALAHTIHLIALAYRSIEFLGMPALQSLLGGGLAYALMFAMAATSNDASMRALGIWWKRLHRAGLHWIWFIFAFSYLKRIFDPGMAMQGLILFPICVIALGIRIAAHQQGKRAKVAVA